MKKLVIIVAIAITAQLQAIGLSSEVYEYIKGSKEVVVTEAGTLARKYTCWKNDGYYPQYTTLLGITIKTYKKCEDNNVD